MTGTAEAGLTADQEKLFVLARSARARVEAVAGAAVMDETGRTYNSAGVNLASLRLSALQVATAMAAAAGARTLAAAVVVGGTSLDAAEVDVFDELAGAGAELLLCAGDRRVLGRWTPR